MVNTYLNYDKKNCDLVLTINPDANNGDGMFAYDTFVRSRVETLKIIVNVNNEQIRGNRFKYETRPSATGSIALTGMIVNSGGYSIGTLPILSYGG